MKPELLTEALIKRAEFISTVLTSGVLLCIGLCLLRFTKKETFELLHIELPLSLFPLTCVAYTLAHLYCTVLFAGLCFKAGPGHQEAWDSLTNKGPIVFAGMHPRPTVLRFPLPFGWSLPITKISLTDPTTWLFYGFCACLYFAFLWSAQLARYPRRWHMRFALLLILANWTCGSVWSYAASTLAGP